MPEDPLYIFTALRWFLDSHVVDDERAGDLRALQRLGWIWLSVGDQAHSEPMQNPEVYERLRPDLEGFDMAMGVAVLGHSRFGLAVFGGDDDEARFDKVYANLWPDRDRAADGQAAKGNGKRSFRDAMHVDTAIRYGASGFITEEHGMLRAHARMSAAFGGFLLMNIADATAHSMERVRHVRHAASVHGRPDPATLPDWPHLD